MEVENGRIRYICWISYNFLHIFHKKMVVLDYHFFFIILLRIIIFIKVIVIINYLYVIYARKVKILLTFKKKRCIL